MTLARSSERDDDDDDDDEPGSSPNVLRADGYRRNFIYSIFTKSAERRKIRQIGFCPRAGGIVASMIPELETLKAIRLDQDWTFPELAAEMEKAAGVSLNAATLNTLLRYDDARPNDRTLYKIRRFLDAWQAAKV